MTAARRYNDPCGIARALDVIGDRWALLIVRELIFGPKRFRQLREGLQSVSPNVLSQRLRDLEDSGVVRRQILDPPAGVPVYDLTERGRALEPVLLELGRWGSQQPLTGPDELSADALFVALKAVFDPRAAADGTFAVNVDDSWFRVIVSCDSIDIARTRAMEPSATFHTDIATLRAVAFGRVSLAAAESEGRITIQGDRDLAERFSLMFQAGIVPVPSSPGADGGPGCRGDGPGAPLIRHP
ncbi:MAG TPA: winged helix-turn-helix transcriptional regulator [Streptosporangiaceae bacterium]|nr:winged helix-turn-helix transcriptional regulator [Streptosporangiaceae bacterium]